PRLYDGPKNHAEAGPSRNSTVGRQPGTLIPGRVMGRLSAPFQRDLVTLEGSAEIGRFRHLEPGADPSHEGGRMKLADFVVPEAIIADLRAGTKQQAAREMVDGLHAVGCVAGADREDVVQAILRREGLGTTGVGDGVAFPEARHRAIPRLLGALALSRGGVGFDAMDGNPVHILFLVAAPWDKPGDFLEAAVIVSWLPRHEALRRRPPPGR